MSVLSDISILEYGSRLIEPFDRARVQPASYDLALGDDLLVPKAQPPRSWIDIRHNDPKTYLDSLSLKNGSWGLKPGACVLACTVEQIMVTGDLVARVEGKSSIGRLFVACHCTAGFVDPGWSGRITLEITNHGPWEIILFAGMKIAQVNFTRLDRPCVKPYGSPGLGSHYQGQTGPEAMKP
jgi:dCTP deaminase